MLEHITDDGCRLAYAIAGPEGAPPLVLSNSLGTDRTLWHDQIDALAERHRVLTYDTRGHGASSAPAPPYSIERLGQDVLSLLDAAGVERAHVCGVSIGGLTALWLGVYAPDRVDRLVLANTAARIGSRELWAARKQAVASNGLESIADATMERWFTARFRQAEPATVARIRATFVGVPVDGYLGCCAALDEADLSEVAPRLRARCLVITGADDPATPPSAGAWLAGVIADARLVELDAAHLSNIERAPEFTAAVLAFLAE